MNENCPMVKAQLVGDNAKMCQVVSVEWPEIDADVWELIRLVGQGDDELRYPSDKLEARLGYEKLRRAGGINKIIKRQMVAGIINPVAALDYSPTMGEKSQRRGRGRPKDVWLLNRDDLLHVVFASEAPGALAFRKIAVKVFKAAMEFVFRQAYAHEGIPPEQVEELIRGMRSQQVEIQDLRRQLESRPWMEAQVSPLVPRRIADRNRNRLALLIDRQLGVTSKKGRRCRAWRQLFSVEQQHTFKFAGTDAKWSEHTWQQAGMCEQYLSRLERRIAREERRTAKEAAAQTKWEVSQSGGQRDLFDAAVKSPN